MVGNPPHADQRRVEEQLLLACARTRVSADVTTRIQALVGADVDWSLVMQLASLHGVRPLLYHNLNRVCQEAVPKPALDHLRGFFQLNTQRSLRLTAELLKIVEAFNNRGLAVAALKGPTLSTVYGHLSLREFADLDVLIEPGNLSAAADLLAKRGYTVEEGDDVEDVPTYSHRFVRDEGSIHVDVHWAMTPGHYGTTPDPESIWGRLDRIQLANAMVPSLAPVDQLVFLCVHGAKHAWERLKWICDVAELIAAHPDIDWNLARTRAAAVRGRRMLALGLVLANDLLDAPVPAAVLERSKRESQVRWLARRLGDRLFEIKDATRVPYSGWQVGKRVEHPLRFGRKLLDGHFLRLLLLDSGDRARYAAYFLQPTESDRAFVSLPTRLSFLYYLLRPVRLVVDYGMRPLAHRLSR